ncbi:SUMF1/EgtB/PvdO family nonheme iron enzyme [Streptomyces oceani]|uniref:Sulfatase-modifying factor enzyme-like domain-containing protein n=1 Tax=Streptomyces oceani TaxID=1075402 RepID=A0A1E7JXK9_9ACTN|nr:SUMF1/EgtB/PvdO family nonheme iron enzyme [Streptomyces oceani]OEU96348.1 hypothetical protein AN216_21050 [Streptomyces oceani]
MRAPSTRPIAGPFLGEDSRDRLARSFTDGWNTYETLFRGVLPSRESFHTRVHPLRLPLVFYLAHTAAFYVQKLKLVGLVEERGVVPELDERMERGVSPEDPDELAELPAWPDLDTVWAYRKSVRDTVLGAIRNVPLGSTVEPESPVRALLMGIEHENIHLHTSLPLVRLLPPRCKEHPAGWPAMVGEREAAPTPGARELEFTRCPGGHVRFGGEQGAATPFRWDNEWGLREAEVDPFAVARHPVTNGQFLEFLRAGGYQRRELWTTHGADLFLDQVSEGRPNSWVATEAGTYRYRGTFEDIDLPWDWPVEVSRHEAVAYANWVGAGLLSEEQFHALLDQEFGGPAEVAYQLGKFNVGLRHGSPRPVLNPHAALGRHGDGVDFVGNVALWLDDDFRPLDDEPFHTDPLYPDFSQPWFGQETGMLAGASYAARGHLAHVGVMRDFMQNHMDQLAGILLTRSA